MYYEEFCTRAKAMLAGHPALTGLRVGEGHVMLDKDANFIAVANGQPVDNAVDVDESNWNGEAFDGMTPKQIEQALSKPEFRQFQFVEALMKTPNIQEFLKLVETAGAITLDDGALLGGGNVIEILTGEPDNEVVRFSWTDGENEFSAIFTEGGIANGSFKSDGKFVCEDQEGNETEFSFFALQRLLPMGHQKVVTKTELSNDKSYGQAEEIAASKQSWSLVDGNEAESYMGKVLGSTEHHVVQSLGKTAVIHHKHNLDRVPEKDEVLTIAYDGTGSAKVEPKAQDKGVSR